MNEKTNSTMSLSEAIRLGSMLGAQMFGRMFGDGEDGCALGSAARALRASTEDEWRAITETRWPEFVLGEYAHLCGTCGETWRSGGNRPTLYQIIAHLNDEHKLSREQIADFVQTIEESLSVKRFLKCPM